MLAKYTCLALRHMNPSKRQSKDGSAAFCKLPNDHAILVKLAAIVEGISDSKEWFGVAEQAFSAIYSLSKHPDTLCSEILRRKTRQVFQPLRQRSGSPMDGVEGQSRLPTPPPEESMSSQQGSLALSQLLFMVGHIAIKQIVHLEICELDFKRRKAEKEKAKTTGTAPVKGKPGDDADE